QAERVQSLREEPAPALGRVDEDPRRLDPLQRQDEARHSPTGPQVERSSRCTARGADETLRMLDVVLDRPWPQEPQVTGPFQDGNECRCAQLDAGEITTRRRGSSPSELVVTPSRSF